MDCFPALVMIGVLAIAQVQAAGAQSKASCQDSALRALIAPAHVSTMPPTPRGKSTVLGGEIRKIDPVRDELTLKVFGQGLIKILFDEHTQVYLDGQTIPIGSLAAADHASVQTVLDGTSVYAVSIHMLSTLPKGEFEGRVISYNPETRELAVGAVMTRQPIKLVVPADTPVIREGQGPFSSQSPGTADLIKGTLVSIQFESDEQGRGLARKIVILALPGSTFQFSGSISSLDMHAGLLELVDPRDDKTYRITFDSGQLPASRNLHEGDHLSVTAKYDGVRYVASALTVD